MTRWGELARNARLAASFVGGTLLTDPAWLVLQAARRTPARVSAVVVPRVERLLGDGTTGEAGRLRAAWQAGDVSAVRAAAPTTRSGRRVRESLLAQVALLEAPTPPETSHHPDGFRRQAGEKSSQLGQGEISLPVHHHLTNSLPHTQSGYTLRTHAILTAQRAAGHPVTATTRAGYPLMIGALGARGEDLVDGVRYRRLVPRSLPADHRRRAADGVDLLVRALEEARPAVVHATTPWTTGDAARAAARRLGLPWVYEVRGLPEETWAASHPTPEARERAAASERFALLRAKETALALAADHVVTLSGTMRDELIGRGVPGARITVVPNAVDAALLEPAPSATEARAALGLRTASFVVGTVSSVVGYEGLDTVLRTVALLRSRGIDVSALVVGDGVDRPRLLRLAAELGLGEHALLPGRVPRDVARTYLAALDVVLVPRRPDRVTRLVTPLKPVEAMALGRPVVASDLPALAEVLSPLEPAGGSPAGALVDPDDTDAWADAVARVLDDADHRAALVAAGRSVAAERTWERLVGRYAGVYARLATPRKDVP
ncbi:glycosyltransferase family 4 protein [Isoptericola sp. 4D.3]|uniref:D-inositol 3-phosphate glycosyltransferase n=1 Tax=Isoptericola peretonis TaxID=2918523 RepID=A0ABT0J5C6_9MICO|nr:glycosyltransferase family 4 protein [Isoptericola sp. 4D.3]